MSKKKLSQKIEELFQSKEEVERLNAEAAKLQEQRENESLRLNVAKVVGYLDIRAERFHYNVGLSFGFSGFEQLKGYLPGSNRNLYDGGREHIPEYSTDIQAATNLLKDIHEVISMTTDANGDWICSIKYGIGIGQDKTLAKAICRAYINWNKNRSCHCDPSCRCHAKA